MDNGGAGDATKDAVDGTVVDLTAEERIDKASSFSFGFVRFCSVAANPSSQKISSF